jgi:hypothetical protein
MTADNPTPAVELLDACIAALERWNTEPHESLVVKAVTRRLHQVAESLAAATSEHAAKALEDAADELGALWVSEGRHFGIPGSYSPGYETWLRRRAAAVRQEGGS